MGNTSQTEAGGCSGRHRDSPERHDHEQRGDNLGGREVWAVGSTLGRSRPSHDLSDQHDRGREQAVRGDEQLLDRVASLGHNLADDSSCDLTATGDLPGNEQPAQLRRLGLVDSSGPTDGIALNPGSPAIGAGDLMACPLTDQRDADRTFDSSCDIGAFEYTSGAPSNYVVSSVGELDAALSSLTQAGIDGTIQLDDGHYDIGNLIGLADVGGGTTIIGQGAEGVILDGNASTAVSGVRPDRRRRHRGDQEVTVENGAGDGIYDDGTLILDNSVLWANKGTGIESVNGGLDVSGTPSTATAILKPRRRPGQRRHLLRGAADSCELNGHGQLRRRHLRRLLRPESENATIAGNPGSGSRSTRRPPAR